MEDIQAIKQRFEIIGNNPGLNRAIDIAICVCIPNGLSGSSSAGAIEDIMTYYFSKLDARSPETLAKPDDVTP